MDLPPLAPHVVLAQGPWDPDQVTAVVQDHRRPTTPAIEKAITRTWQTQRALAVERGRDLFDGRLWRLAGWESSDPGHPGLHLTLGACGYREFVGTNLFGADLLQEHSWEYLANPVGTSALLATRDGFTILGLRSQSVAFHQGHRHAFGGMLEEEDRAPDDSVDVFAAMRRELREEVGLTDAELMDMTCLALVRDEEIHQPELLFEATVPLTASQVQQRWPQAPSSGEHQNLVIVPRHRESLQTLLGTTTPISGVAAAAVQQVQRLLPMTGPSR